MGHLAVSYAANMRVHLTVTETKLLLITFTASFNVKQINR